ncbi:MAG: hypothetical protein WC082_14055 [Victivallales bacterium]|jgi:hypothetical protein
MAITVNSLDKEIREEELDAFLPENIFDAHVHLWSEQHIGECREFAPQFLIHAV